MNKWIIIVHDNGRMSGWYLGQDASGRAYTPKLYHARLFNTREAAEAEACGNETVVPLESVFSSPDRE